MSTENVANETMPISKFKVVLIGDGGVGKTTFINRHRTGEFTTKYSPTMGVEVSVLNFYTNIGEVVLNIWDCAGQEKYGGLRDGYYIGADATIIMCDVTSKVTCRSIHNWYKDLSKVKDDIPIVLCGNKSDCKDRKVSTEDMLLYKKHDMTYYDISAKSNYNFEKPFLSLIRQLLKNDTICFVEGPAVLPPEIKINHHEHQDDTELEGTEHDNTDNIAYDGFCDTLFDYWHQLPKTKFNILLKKLHIFLQNEAETLMKDDTTKGTVDTVGDLVKEININK